MFYKEIEFSVRNDENEWTTKGSPCSDSFQKKNKGKLQEINKTRKLFKVLRIKAWLQVTLMNILFAFKKKERKRKALPI